MLTDEVLDRMRRETDPLADDVARAIIAARNATPHDIHTPDDGGRTFHEWTGFSGPIPRGVHAQLDRYLDETDTVPRGYDAELLARGESVYGAYGPECMIVLLLRSLPAGYIQRHIAETLHSTARMTLDSGSLGQLTRRVLETLQFLINVMTPGGMTRGGIGITSAQKVRLIHATIRAFSERMPRYDPSGPATINQEELVMTILTFSVLVVDGLRALGVRLEPADEEGILHMWRHVGYHMGIPAEYLPSTMRDARELWDTIYRRNFDPSPAGVELTTALLAYVQSLTPGRIIRHAPPLVFRHLNGTRLSTELGVRGMVEPVETAARLSLRAVFAILSKVETLLNRRTTWSRRFNIQLLQELLLEWNDRKKMTFDIPQSLQDAWSMTPKRIRHLRVEA